MLHSFKRSKTVTVIVAVILNTVLSVLAIVFWINDGSVAFSFAFFCSLISFFYLCVFGITVNHDERSVFRDISFGSFGSFIIISVVGAFLISDGELIESLDFSGAADDKKAGKNKKA